jgi:hypothetical protein
MQQVLFRCEKLNVHRVRLAQAKTNQEAAIRLLNQEFDQISDLLSQSFKQVIDLAKVKEKELLLELNRNRELKRIELEDRLEELQEKHEKTDYLTDMATFLVDNVGALGLLDGYSFLIEQIETILRADVGAVSGLHLPYLQGVEELKTLVQKVSFEESGSEPQLAQKGVQLPPRSVSAKLKGANRSETPKPGTLNFYQF